MTRPKTTPEVSKKKFGKHFKSALELHIAYITKDEKGNWVIPDVPYSERLKAAQFIIAQHVGTPQRRMEKGMGGEIKIGEIRIVAPPNAEIIQGEATLIEEKAL